MSETKSTARYRPETRLVHSGTLRSQFGETSEALFLTQGFVYDTAEQCEARFKGEEPGFLYSRFSNPNISMFERRMIELEGAEAARATATGMAAVTTAILAPLKAGDHVVAAKAMFGSCRYVVEDLLPRYGISSTLVDGLDLDQWQKAMRPNTKTCFLESPTNPTLDVLDIGAHRRDRACRRRAADRRQRVCDADLAEPADARRRRRGVFRDQAYRRPGPLPRRHHSVVGSVHRRAHPQFHAPDRPVDVAVQRLGAAEGAGDAGRARPRPDRNRRRDRRRAGAASENLAADLSRPIRSSAGRIW